MTCRANQTGLTEKWGKYFFIMKLITLVTKTRKDKNQTLQMDSPRIKNAYIPSICKATEKNE